MAYALINRVIAGGTIDSVTTGNIATTEAAAVAQAELITATRRG